MFDRWDWDDTAGAAAMVVIAIVLGAILTVFFAPKNVTYYYLGGGSTTGSSCAYAHWTWHTDEVAFCSEDEDKVIDYAVKANQMLKSK